MAWKTRPLISCLLLLAACDSGGSSGTITPTPTATATPTPAPTSTPTPTPTATPAAMFDLQHLTPGKGVVFKGHNASDRTGFAVAGVGDVNGDGVPDYAVGVSPNTYAVVFGGSTPPGVSPDGRLVLDYTAITSSQGFIVDGKSTFIQDGANNIPSGAVISIGAAGDLNGDGFDDIVLGAPTLGIQNQGGGYVIFGTGSGFGTSVGGQSVISLANMAGAQGFSFRGKDGGDSAGRSVSSAGDLNGDGIDDLLVGSPEAYNGNSGNAYVMFGHTGKDFGELRGSRRVVFLGGLNVGEGVLITGTSVGAYVGTSVAPVGDFNGDGIDDIVLGGPADDAVYTNGGAAFVIFGTRGSFGPSILNQTTISATTLPPERGLVIGGDAGSGAGTLVQGAGDVNGDGLQDLFVYGAQNDTYRGRGFVIFGKSGTIGQSIGGRQVLNLVTLSPSDGFVLTGIIGTRMPTSGAGDFNGDGIGDFLIGDPFRDAVGTSSGVAYVVFGSRTGFGTLENGRALINLEAFAAGQGLLIRGEGAGDFAGASVAGLTDVNGDGKADILIGAPGPEQGTALGLAYLVYGFQP